MHYSAHYSCVSKILHWLVALLVTLVLCFSFFLPEVPKPYQPTAYMIHKSIGLTILVLVFIRIFWMWRRGRPALPITVAFWEKMLSRLVQYSMYIALICMAMSGWIMSVAANRTPTFFGLFQVSLPISPNEILAKQMNQIHVTLVWVLIGLIVLHIVGALKHYLIDKDSVLESMF